MAPATAERRTLFPEGRTPLYAQRWDYMPHVTGLYDKLTASRGHSRTWFGGGLMGFELTDCITGWTCLFVDCVCVQTTSRPRQRTTEALAA